MAGGSSSDVMRGGYWPKWRDNVESIDTKFFTHIYFAFLNLKFTNGTYTLDVSRDDDIKLSNFTRKLRSKGQAALKILLSIGGAAAGTQLFTAMASDEHSRRGFIDSAIGVARQYDFDGLDLDWEFPSNAEDMRNLGLLLEEWKKAIVNDPKARKSGPLLLAAAVHYSARIDYNNATYPVDSMFKNLDWINIMTYDYHGPWEEPIKTGAHTALFDPNSEKNTAFGIRSWINARQGVPKHKLVLGLAMYGRVWLLNDQRKNGIGEDATVPEDENLRTMAFSEILEFNGSNGSRVVRDNMPDRQSSHSVYAISREKWIGYDDKYCIKRKVEYAREQGIRGYFFWEIGHDSNWTLSREAFNA